MVERIAVKRQLVQVIVRCKRGELREAYIIMWWQGNPQPSRSWVKRLRKVQRLECEPNNTHSIAPRILKYGWWDSPHVRENVGVRVTIRSLVRAQLPEPSVCLLIENEAVEIINQQLLFYVSQVRLLWQFARAVDYFTGGSRHISWNKKVYSIIVATKWMACWDKNPASL